MNFTHFQNNLAMHKNKIYVKKFNDKLRYVFVDPNNKLICGELTERDLHGYKITENMSLLKKVIVHAIHERGQIPAGSIDGLQIDSEGYLIRDGNRIPIKDLGLGAVFIAALRLQDIHFGNWGLVDCGSYFQVKIIDLDDYFASEFSIPGLDSIASLSKASELLTVYFDVFEQNSLGQNPHVPILPSAILQAKYIHQEIYNALFSIKSFLNQQEVEDLVKDVFKNQFHLGMGFLDTLRKNIDELYNQLLPEMLANCSSSMISKK